MSGDTNRDRRTVNVTNEIKRTLKELSAQEDRPMGEVAGDAIKEYAAKKDRIGVQ